MKKPSQPVPPCPAEVQAALTLLLGPYLSATRLGRPARAFALEQSILRQTGIRDNQLKELVAAGYVEPLRKPTRAQALAASGPGGGDERVGFVLTPAGADVALPFAGLVVHAGQEKRQDAPKPEWVADDFQVWFRGELVRQFKRTAPNPIRLLTAFQTQQWAPRIRNPMLGDEDYPAPDQLLDTVKNLNRTLRGKPLEFKADRSRQGVRWYDLSDTK
jgi:hypothetical protein